MNGTQRTALDLKNGENTFTVEVTDAFGYKYSESKTLRIGSQTTTNPDTIPTITMINPKNQDSRITLYSGDSFNLRFSVSV